MSQARTHVRTPALSNIMGPTRVIISKERPRLTPRRSFVYNNDPSFAHYLLHIMPFVKITGLFVGEYVCAR